MGADCESAGQLLGVEVAYASPHRQVILKLTVAPGTTAGQAIDVSGIRDQFPEIGLEPPIGVFSRKVAADYALADGDRVEIYRALRADPKELRRQKAQTGRTGPRSRHN